MIKVRVGGVPEHFNLAWHLAIENGIFKQNNIDIEWVNVPGGTGAMTKALRNNELDIAIALTEGITKDILLGNPSKIAQFYVNSPLRWGIFVKAGSPINSIGKMQGLKYAISRYGSGSHLMPYVNAQNNNLTINSNDFVLVNNLDGARKALAENTAQLFMWEKYTTKPYVENGEFNMIGECNTPWPCFVIVATNNFIEKQEATLTKILNIINHSCSLLKNNLNAASMIENRYGINIEDAKQWFIELEYACQPLMDEVELRLILWRLHKFGIIEELPALSDIIYTKNLELINGLMIE